VGVAVGVELRGKLLRLSGAVPWSGDEAAVVDELDEQVRLWDVPGALRVCVVVAAAGFESACRGWLQVSVCVPWYGFVELADGAGGSTNSETGSNSLIRESGHGIWCPCCGISMVIDGGNVVFWWLEFEARAFEQHFDFETYLGSKSRFFSIEL